MENLSFLANATVLDFMPKTYWDEPLSDADVGYLGTEPLVQVGGNPGSTA
jgi:hypothetical protein